MDENEIKALKDNSRKAFEKVYREYAPRLYRFAEGYVMNAQEAEDIVQDAFLRFLEALPALPDTTDVGNYLYSTAKNLCLNYLKHLQVEDSHKEKLTEALIFSGSLEYEDDSELLDKVKECVKLLPDQQRKIVELKIFRDMSYKEIAKELRISEVTVHTHVKRAYQTIRELIPPESLEAILPFLLLNGLVF